MTAGTAIERATVVAVTTRPMADMAAATTEATALIRPGLARSATGPLDRGWRRRTSGGALLCLAIVLGGCAGPTGSLTTSTGSMTAAASSVASPALSPAEQLDQALAAFEDGYDFVAEVTVGDVVATHGEGRRVGGDSETVVGSGDGKVVVRTVGKEAWTMKPGEAWVAIEGPTDANDQIAVLRSPTSVAAAAPIDGSVSLVATYPKGALGLDGSETGSVIVLIHPDGTVEVTYEVPLQTGSAISHTLFSPLTDSTPITAPG